MVGDERHCNQRLTLRAAERVVELARKGGTPVRYGKFGYEAPAHIRIAVREPKHQDALFAAWKPAFAAE